MNDIPFDIVGFDLDGTLLDTHRDLGEAVNHALELGGYDRVPVEQIESLIGGGAKIMLKKALDDAGGVTEEEFRPLYKALLAYYAEHNAVHSRPYDGAIAMLDGLAERGIKMAVVTNKFESFATDILTKLDLASYFETIIGGDTMGKGRSKPQPDPIFEAIRRCGGGPCVFIGDSTYDMAAARAANVPVVAAAYGYCDRPAHELGADIVIESLYEFIPALQNMPALQKN
ncbi:HAD-IA family hydrolase [Altererythrobacter confluentis]|uniref:Phosphoglycolate phosphatase n=1 Tax=Allopontixanthobacter confluentis TaxID=1849021 RepID=A0A6L7GI59_9SPHN|nr:HAD-IA family hydrolase [Allopontixanthobacter confluentis]MXP14598.1 HAD-IA family hydrolase [Allopontixanthobacter confluentis]